MLRTLLLTARAAVTGPVEMLAFPARLWFSSHLRYSETFFQPLIHMEQKKEVKKPARPLVTFCKQASYHLGGDDSIDAARR